MKYLIISTMLLFSTPIKANPIKELSGFITDFLKLYPKRQQIALSYIPTIVAECGEDIDPLLIAVLISIESSWKFKAKGRLNEQGLMQIMPKYGKKFQLNDPHEQIRAGIDHFRQTLKLCNGDIKDAINAYGSGKCKPHYQFLKWRWKWYQRAIKKYRKE